MRKPDLIRDLRQAYVDILAKHDKLYHFDDDAHTICAYGKESKPTFTKEEASLVNQLSSALHSEELFEMAVDKINETARVRDADDYCPF